VDDEEGVADDRIMAGRHPEWRKYLFSICQQKKISSATKKKTK
jgi:hypothetical protein